MTAQGSLPSWLPFMNRFVTAANRLGLRMGPVNVLTVPGRVSGAPRATPITPITVSGRRYLVAALPQGDWAKNVRAAGAGVLASGRRSAGVVLTEVDDPALRRAVMRAFPRQARGGVLFMVRLGLVTKDDPDEFEAAADSVAVFEVAPQS